MKVLALDLSTKSGWALLIDESLFDAGRILVGKFEEGKEHPYPMNLIRRARAVAQVVGELVNTYQPDVVVIEETNQPGLGRSRDSQKVLEFIQFSVAELLFKIGKIPVYMASSKWRKMTGSKLSKEDREKNTATKLEREAAKDRARELIEMEVIQEYQSRVEECADRQGRQQVRKEMSHEIRRRMSKAVRSIRTPYSVKTVKHRSVEICNELFGNRFKAGDHDITEAILLGLGYFKTLKK